MLILISTFGSSISLAEKNLNLDRYFSDQYQDLGIQFCEKTDSENFSTKSEYFVIKAKEILSKEEWKIIDRFIYQRIANPYANSKSNLKQKVINKVLGPKGEWNHLKNSYFDAFPSVKLIWRKLKCKLEESLKAVNKLHKVVYAFKALSARKITKRDTDNDHWHVDPIEARIFITYEGPGTLLTPQSNVYFKDSVFIGTGRFFRVHKFEDVCQLEPGDAVILFGQQNALGEEQKLSHHASSKIRKNVI